MTPKEVLAQIRQSEVKTVDLRFMDFPGVWQHFAIPAEALTEETFEEGISFDGSSVVGWRAINEADLLVVPQPETALIDPFTARPTLTMICNIQDPITQQDYTRDPRNIARKAVSYMKSTGLADACRSPPSSSSSSSTTSGSTSAGHEAYYHVDSAEGAWNRGRREAPNLGYKAGSGLGYFPCPPTDSLADLRTEMAQMMADCGIATAAHYHEVATGGQSEIDLVRARWSRGRPGDARPVHHPERRPPARARPPRSCPSRSTATTARACTPTSPSGRDDQPLLAGGGYAGLSDLGLYAVGGLLKHAAALCAFANPTTNSYKRLVPGYEAPTKLSYSRRNRSAIIRIPIHSPSPKSRRIEFRVPDARPTLTCSTRPC